MGLIKGEIRKHMIKGGKPLENPLLCLNVVWVVEDYQGDVDKRPGVDLATALLRSRLSRPLHTFYVTNPVLLSSSYLRGNGS